MDTPQFVYSLVNWLTFGSFLFELWWMLLLWKLMSNFMYRPRFSILLGLYVGVKFFGHMVTVRLTYWETGKFFQSSCTILIPSQQCLRVPISPRCCQHLLWFIFLHALFFLFFRLDNLNWPLFPTCWFFLLLVQICCAVGNHFSYCTYSNPELPFGPFLIIIASFTDALLEQRIFGAASHCVCFCWCHLWLACSI